MNEGIKLLAEEIMQQIHEGAEQSDIGFSNGVGDLLSRNFGDSKAMGGTSLAMRRLINIDIDNRVYRKYL